MSTAISAERLAEVVRTEGARILATLVRTVGDLQTAEDAVQEAAIAALTVWPRTGLPADPRAWLSVTARHKALDHLRREARRAGKEADGAVLMELSRPAPVPDEAVRDDVLRLVFTCCHPTLAIDAQVALALRTLCGLSTTEVARTLLVPEATMSKRLVRVKHKIAKAAIPYRVPSDDELPSRLGGVCAVIHLVYTAGHTAAGDQLVRVDLCEEAIRLGRLLHDLLPDEPSVTAVLALVLLTDARRPARLDAAGAPVLLADQDRASWDHAKATEGVGLLVDSLARTDGLADSYQLQAAIAACHSTARRWDETDWSEIARLYALLEEVQPGAAVRINRAVAVGHADGPRLGLALLDAVPGIDGNHLAHTARGELLVRAGDHAGGVRALRRALSASPSPAEARHLRSRLTALEPSLDNQVGPDQR